MIKTILTAAAAFLVSAGSSFAAGGDHFPAYEPVAATSIDYGATASTSDGQKENALKTTLATNATIQGSDRTVWGR